MQQGISCDVRKQPKSAVALDITVGADTAQSVHMTVMSALGKKANVPGFRKGKVPPEALINHIGVQKVKKATVEEIIDLGMKQAGGQVQLQTAGQARLDGSLDDVASDYSLGSELKFTVLVDVYPEVPLTEADYKGLKVQVERVPFNDEAYDMSLLKLRDQHPNLSDAPAGEPAKWGDQIFANMEGFHMGPEGSKGDPLPAVAGGEGVQIPLTDGRFMFGLAEGMEGIKEGETRDVQVTFPSRTSVPQLAGKEAIFSVTCLKVQKRELPACDDEFANKVSSGMSWETLDSKLREGVQEEVDAQQQKATHRMLERALTKVLPESMEVPETLVEEVTKERFAATLADMRNRGASDEKLKELISAENFEKYRAVSRPSTVMQIKGDLALKEVGRQQGLAISEKEIDDEMMTLQAQAVQRGEKFKPSEVRPKVEAQLEKNLYLGWLEQHSEVELVDEQVETVDDILGASPEQLAESVKASGLATDAAAPEPQAAAPAPAPEPTATAEPEPVPEEAPAPAKEAPGAATPTVAAPDGFEWGATF